MPVAPESFAEAAATVMLKLCEATSAVEGRNAFQYFLPPLHSTWALMITGGGDGSELAQCAVSHVRMAATVDGRFRTPQDAQRFVMQVLGVVPLDNVDRVQRLHLVQTPTITAEVVTLANQDEPGLFYRAAVPLELVFIAS